MTTRQIAIIGAGIGGLAAGCTAQLLGFRSQILEAHALPGGLCTAWMRKGYTFDGSIHHLAGCRPGTHLHRMWEELGAMPREVIFPEDLTQVESPDGRTLTIFTDLDRLSEHLLTGFPIDRRPILRYLRAVDRMRRYDLLDVTATGPSGLVRYLPVLSTIVRAGQRTMRQAAGAFRDPFLRRAFPSLQYDWPDTPLLLHLNVLAQCVARNYGVPAGGSLEFSRAIAERYRELGGEIRYRARVSEVLVERGGAAGVRLSDGETIRADAVISNAFAHTTIFGLLGGRFIDNRIRSMFQTPEETATMGIHVSLGVDRDLSGEPHSLVLLLDQPVTIADRPHDRIPFELFHYDPCLAPAGKGVVKVLLNTSYPFWKALSENRSRYEDAKARTADGVIAVLELRFPGLREQIEAIDVATPLTTERYTGNGQGFAAGGALPLPMLFARPMRLPGLRRFYLVGQSAGGAGIPGCAAMGRNAVRAVRHEFAGDRR